MGFGAAAVIVLTIIIVLILYLILQCRSQRRKRRAARAAGLHCDSNSGSYMERSTVDFIVPGEMELTSAVRSVSASNKCNGTTKALVPPIPKDKDGCGSGNDGDDEEDYHCGAGNKKNVVYKSNHWNNGGSLGFLPPYRHPPPYGVTTTCPSQRSNPIMCQCCGQIQTQQLQWFQSPHQQPQAQFMMPAAQMQPPRMCLRTSQLGNPNSYQYILYVS